MGNKIRVLLLLFSLIMVLFLASACSNYVDNEKNPSFDDTQHEDYLERPHSEPSSDEEATPQISTTLAPVFPTADNEIILRDLIAYSSVLNNNGDITVDSFEIAKRQTNEDDKEDYVYVDVTASNDIMEGNFSCKMLYVLYNDGWLFETIELLSETFRPTVEVNPSDCSWVMDSRFQYYQYSHQTQMVNEARVYFKAMNCYPYMNELYTVSICCLFQPNSEGKWGWEVVPNAGNNYTVESNKEDWGAIYGLWELTRRDSLIIDGTSYYSIEIDSFDSAIITGALGYTYEADDPYFAQFENVKKFYSGSFSVDDDLDTADRYFIYDTLSGEDYFTFMIDKYRGVCVYYSFTNIVPMSKTISHSPPYESFFDHERDVMQGDFVP